MFELLFLYWPRFSLHVTFEIHFQGFRTPNLMGTAVPKSCRRTQKIVRDCYTGSCMTTSHFPESGSRNKVRKSHFPVWKKPYPRSRPLLLITKNYVNVGTYVGATLLFAQRSTHKGLGLSCWLPKDSGHLVCAV